MTNFRYPEDKGHFDKAILRCVGIGKCRQRHTQIMCPSYKVTLEEKHCTHGRARLLFETMRGEVITDLWQSEAMKESLDLCLACKGCKSNCPVHVAMAAYKAEFLAHYYRHKPQPATSLCVRLDRPLGGTGVPCIDPGELAGSEPRLWRSRKSLGRSGTATPLVVLWPDTFNNHFHPEPPKAAVKVLEAAGFQVRISERQIYCGWPLYDFGMLDQAKSQLRRILSDLRKDIDNGISIVGLEPACVAVFRDELVNLFPKDELAQRLSRQTYFLVNFF